MNTLFKSILSLTAILIISGCASTLVQYPPLPEAHGIVDYKYNYIEPTKYIVENGNESITKGGVTVTISDISDDAGDDKFTTFITGPNGKNHKVGITPMMLVMRVKNNTNHIITLRNTIIKIEDENQNDYPLINNLQNAKEDLANRISRSFDNYIDQGSIFFKKNILENEQYLFDYEIFVTELTDAKNSGLGEVRTPDMEKGTCLTDVGFKNVIERWSPEYIYQKSLDSFKANVAQFKANAITQMRNGISENIGNIITSGVYQPISLIPGRATKIVAPFNIRKEGEVIEILYVNIFDLPTMVDAAGNPTKRDHFNFTLKAVH